MGIAWLISSLVVNAVNFQAVRAFSNIIEKVLKRILPLLTNPNAASAVPFPIGIFRIKAALLHRTPSLICRAVNTPVAMLYVFWTFVAALDTTKAYPSKQAGICNFTNPTAIALGYTESVGFSARFSSGRCIRDDFPFAKTPSDEWYSSRHNDSYLVAVFSGGHPASTGARCDFSA